MAKPRKSNAVEKKLLTSLKPPAEIQIRNYLDYRQYLKDLSAHFKAHYSDFSSRTFSQLAELGGNSYLTMILNGERNLTPVTVAKFSKALRLNAKETLYFENLVLFNQTKNEDERDRYFTRLAELRHRTPATGLKREQFKYMSNSLFAIVREMTSLPNFQDDPEWIASKLRRPATKGQVAYALETLNNLGLVVRGDDGRYRHSETLLQSPDDVGAADIMNYHRQILSESKEAVFNVPYEEWDMASMTLPVQKKNISQVMGILSKCREEIASLINNDSPDYHEVFQINMQVFPVTKVQQNDAAKNELEKDL